MTAQQKSMGPVEWAKLVALSVVWGATFFFVELALEGLPPVTLVALRVLLAALVLHIYVRAVGQKVPMRWQFWGPLGALALLNNVIPFNLIIWGQTQINGSLASILNATTPVFVVLLAHFLTRDERMTPARGAGVLLGFAGVAIMTGLEALNGLSLNFLAQLAVVAASFSYACAGIYARQMHAVPALMTATGQLTMSAIFMIPIAAFADQPWQLAMPSLLVLAATCALAAVSTAFAYLLYFQVLASAGATNVLLVTFLIPVSALMFGMGLLGEQLAAKHFAGMALIGLGLVLIDGRVFARWTAVR